tara:strand:- start:336 stop:656 length:321 start_codon:yes stop_codon:yes gene_type:complete
MNKDVWMTSEGLQVDFAEPSDPTYIKVHLGDLQGDFISLDSEKMRLTFETSDIELSLNYIQNSPKEAIIVYGNFLHKLVWENHNYSIKRMTKHTLLVTVEETNEQK